MKRNIIVIFLLILLMLVLKYTRSDSEKDSRYGGRLVWGVCHKPVPINPVFTTNSVSASLLDLVFNRLVRWNAKGEIEPDLAESWEISEDGLIYTFHLRKGVKFHDGRECTAFDVKFTYDVIINPEVDSPFKTSFEPVKEFKAVDAHTFQIILKKPFVPVMCRLTKEIIPKHLFSKTDIKTNPYNFRPIGTGPFKFKEWTADNTIILEYNPDYHEGRPCLDEIIIKTYPDSRELWSALMRKEVDLVLFIDKEDYDILKNDASFKSYTLPTDYYYAVCYNLNDPVLKDIRIRQAIAQAINVKRLINTVAGGYGMECSGPFSPNCLGCNPSIKLLEYNPDKAKQLLKNAGWIDANKDGILDKEGKTLKIKLLVDAKSNDQKRIAMFIRQELQEIGIMVEVVLYDDERILTKEFIKDNKVQAQLKLFLAGIDPDQEKDDWCPKETRTADKLWIYYDENINKLFELGKITHDKQDRKQIYQKIHKLIYKKQPACFLYFPSHFHAVSTRFKNTEEFFNINMPFYTIKNWHISNEQAATDKEQR